MAQYPKYSIVIPAYNESARIPATLRSVVDCIRARGWNAEVIVVNDGSRDNTAAVVRDFAQTAPEVRLLENPTNRGKGLQRAPRHSARAGRHRHVYRRRSVLSDRRGRRSVRRHRQRRRHRHRLALAGHQPPDPSPAALPAVLRPLLQPAHAHGDEPALCRHAMRIQGISPAPPRRPSFSCRPSNAGASIPKSSSSPSSAATRSQEVP